MGRGTLPNLRFFLIAKAEAKHANEKSLSDPSSTDDAEFKCILQLLKDSIPADPTKYNRMATKCKGISEETTTGCIAC